MTPLNLRTRIILAVVLVATIGLVVAIALSLGSDLTIFGVHVRLTDTDNVVRLFSITAVSLFVLLVRPELLVQFLGKDLRLAEAARDEARAKAQPALENEGLQDRAIDLHVARLTNEIDGLRRRAFASFVPGVLLCIGSAAGPWVAVQLASDHPDHWQYMLGGSALALVLLGAGSALLRHDAKLHEQVQASKSELLYFSRVKTGLDCARTLSAEDYKKGLALVTAHLLAAPPSLALIAQSPEEKKGEKAKAETDNAERQAIELLLETVKAKADKS